MRRLPETPDVTVASRASSFIRVKRISDFTKSGNGSESKIPSVKVA
jgi:hypothetical protein